MCKEEALHLAKYYGYENEVAQSIEDGMSPEQALIEWDVCCNPTELYY